MRHVRSLPPFWKPLEPLEPLEAFKHSGQIRRAPVYTAQGREAWREPVAAPGPVPGEYNVEKALRNGKITPYRWTMQGKTEPLSPARGERATIKPGPGHYKLPSIGGRNAYPHIDKPPMWKFLQMKQWAALPCFLALCGAEHVLRLQRHDFQPTTALENPNSTVFQSWPTRTQTGTHLDQLLMLLRPLAHSSLRSEELRDRQNLFYTAAVEIGVPPQEVQLILDTGSSDLWVSHRVFHLDWSDTWSSEGYPVNMTYGIGSMSGVYGLDQVCLHTSPERTCIREQPVIYGLQTHDIPDKIHGVLGLAFIGLSHVHHTFLRNLNRSFADLAFAFALRRGDEESLFTVGNYDEVLARGFQVTGIDEDSVVRADVLNIFRVEGEAGPQAGWWLTEARVKAQTPHKWTLRFFYFLYTQLYFMLLLCCIASLRYLARWYCWAKVFSYVIGLSLILYFLQVLTVGNFDHIVLACLDTGTSLISIPEGQFLPVVLGLFGTAAIEECALSGGVELLCPCSVASSATPLTIYFGEKPITLQPANMFMKVGSYHGEDICMTGLSSSNQGIWILGDVFLRHVYAVHSFNRKEVAMLPYADAVVETVEIPAHLWVWAATAAAAGFLASMLVLLFTKKSVTEPTVGAAVRVPLLQPEAMSMSRI
ncbi:PAG [Symbiodinium natans]|uniref:PAG protein n=1 Tax=Symbiodinium natans TaxID=878477 RepID=A0A812TP82_9DINO|nr:PAG [Symbiodinium natans]